MSFRFRSTSPRFYANQFSEQEQTRISQLWNGAALNQQYRQLQQQMADWLAHAPSLEPEVAARESFYWVVKPFAKWCLTRYYLSRGSMSLSVIILLNQYMLLTKQAI